MDKDFYSFARITDIALGLNFRISSLQGKVASSTRTELLSHPDRRLWGANKAACPDLYVEVRLYADNKPLTVPLRTAYKPFKHNTQWNEWITLPYKLADLPLNAQLAFTVYDIASSSSVNVVGGSTFRLFSKKGTLKTAQHRLFLWKGVAADPSVETSTPSKVGGLNDEMGRLEKLIKRHERGDVPRIDWLDKLAYRQIERIHAVESETSDHLFLYIDMPRFDLPVVFCEPEPKPQRSASASASASAPLPQPQPQPQPVPASASASAGAGAGVAPSPQPSLIHPGLFTIYDPESVRDNPVEAKHRRLVRSHRSGPLDRELKPNAAVRDELNEILSYPPTRVLSAAEMDRVWSFRFYLTRDPKGLTKFLKSVYWTDAAEAKQATEVLLPMWAQPGLDDALELLGPGPSFRDLRVRAYAVRQLERADDAQLVLYLLQLVQALKFDPASASHSHSNSDGDGDSDGDSGLADFLIRRALRHSALGNNLYWYLVVETDDPHPQYAALFRRVRDRFLAQTPLAHTFARQADLIHTLSKRAKELRASRDARPRKIEKLRAALATMPPFSPPLPLPLDAEVSVSSITPDRSTVFKSNLFPLRLAFTTAEGGDADRDGDGDGQAGEYMVIFKNGDDLRQDQLVIQLFTLMDRLLRNENLDLRITPYKVLATGPVDGMVQFVESMSIAAIMAEYGGSLLNYLRHYHADQASVQTYGVAPAVLDTFVRSCAGYCVVTYLLGVGDRHLDNLLLSPDGHFFHVDFGYMLGRDPKPFPPTIKICREMVDGMGGASSVHYTRFRSLCLTAFSILRKNANLLLNLVALMVAANIPDIKVEPDKAVLKVQDKFLLDQSEDEAIKTFGLLLNENNYWGTVFDRLHDMAQYFRQ